MTNLLPLMSMHEAGREPAKSMMLLLLLMLLLLACLLAPSLLLIRLRFIHQIANELSRKAADSPSMTAATAAATMTGASRYE